MLREGDDMRVTIREEEMYPVFHLDPWQVAAGGVEPEEFGVKIPEKLLKRYMAADIEWRSVQDELNSLHDQQEREWEKIRPVLADPPPKSQPGGRVVYCPRPDREDA